VCVAELYKIILLYDIYTKRDEIKRGHK